jgi:outer membrane phospholipase A
MPRSSVLLSRFAVVACISGISGIAAADDTPKPSEEAISIVTFHRANYFVTGFTHGTEAKFQLSVKYDLWPAPGHHTVYLAYTQKSLWDIYETSAPFRETNYAPEIFYAFYHGDHREDFDQGCGFFSERAGAEHESNGQSAEQSRSWNRLFVDTRFACRRDHAYVVAGLRAWLPIGLRENPEIVKTQGYGELTLTAGNEDPNDPWSNGIVSLVARKGTSKTLSKGSIQIDARFRLFAFGWPFVPFLWTQLFTGYGESLLTYDRATTGFRVGIGLSDRIPR